MTKRILLRQIIILYLFLVRTATTTDPLREKTLHALESLRLQERRTTFRESRRIISCILLKPHSSFESCTTTSSNVLLEVNSKPPLNLGVKNGLFSSGVVSEGPTLDTRTLDNSLPGTSSYSTMERKNIAAIHEGDIPVKDFIDQVNEVSENEREAAIEDARKSFPRYDSSSPSTSSTSSSSSRPHSQMRTTTTTTTATKTFTTNTSERKKGKDEEEEEKAEKKLENKKLEIPKRDWQLYDDYDENIGDSELMRFHRIQTRVVSSHQEQQKSDDDLTIQCKLNGGTACGYTSATSPNDAGPSLADEVEAMKSDDDDEDDDNGESTSLSVSSSSEKASPSSWKEELNKIRKSIAEEDEAEQETAAIHFLVNKLSGERNAACTTRIFSLSSISV